MDGFKQRLRQAINRCGEPSLRQISIKAGFAETHLANLLGNPDLERSTTGPGFFGIARLCEVLEITPNFLAGVSDLKLSSHDASLDKEALSIAELISDLVTSANSRPTEGQLFSAYVKGGARLEAFANYMDYCDLLDAPSTGKPLNLLHVAPNGLTAAALGSTDPQIVNQAVSTAVDQDFARRMFAAHQEAEEKGYLVSLEDIDVRTKSLAKRIRAQYVRTLFALTDAEGRKYILNHAKPIS